MESISADHERLLANDLPKFLFSAQPGVVITEDKAKWYTEHLRNSRTVDLGRDCTTCRKIIRT